MEKKKAELETGENIKESTEKGQHPILKFLERANKMTSTKILKDPHQDTS